MIHIFQNNANGFRVEATLLLIALAWLLFIPASVFATDSGHIAFVSNRSGNNEQNQSHNQRGQAGYDKSFARIAAAYAIQKLS